MELPPPPSARACRAAFFSLPIAAAFILSGCSGSEDTKDAAPTPPAPSSPSAKAPMVTSEMIADVAPPSGTPAAYRSTRSTSPAVVNFKSDGAGGADLTLRIDGTDRTVRFTKDHQVTESGSTEITYSQMLGNWRYDMHRMTPFRSSLDSDSEFAHFDAYYFQAREASDTQDVMRRARGGMFVHGTPSTPPQTGTASYSGSFWSKLINTVSVPSPSAGNLRSDDVTLNMDFANRSFSGAIQNVNYQAVEQVCCSALAGQFTIAGTITDSGLTADMTGTGDLAIWDLDMQGHTFGPQAAEFGGVVGGESSDGRLLAGSIGAKKQ